MHGTKNSTPIISILMRMHLSSSLVLKCVSPDWNELRHNMRIPNPPDLFLSCKFSRKRDCKTTFFDFFQT